MAMAAGRYAAALAADGGHRLWLQRLEPPDAPRFLGLAELAGSLGVAFGVFPQLAALGLVLVMFGAIQKKLFVWHTGFWGKNGSGWHYDAIMVVMNLVIIGTGGGRLGIMHL